MLIKKIMLFGIDRQAEEWTAGQQPAAHMKH